MAIAPWKRSFGGGGANDGNGSASAGRPRRLAATIGRSTPLQESSTILPH